ncbi:ABC transporter ATP-binding protein [Euryarchaeota archaeon SM23-78]|nr:MAG: ABC transporter ATP-binding protein [Euryarchaeota archaeon SM23-78]MBW3000618.1 ABC transporter ATP-binding protein [Candidatus Woesearchaeota archaeon]
MTGSHTNTIIELRNVWKTYTMGEVKVNALCGLDLKVRKGEFVSIMGPSGSGKSTAMNMIGALDIPSKGMILLEGQDIAKLTESDLAQIRGRKIGFIFQQFNLIPTLSALENIMLPMIFQNIPRYERMEIARKLLKMVDLGDRIYHKPTELSGGEQQRVAIARALSNDPEVVLADEPTGNLDSKTGETVIDFLKQLHKKEGKTIVMVTHDPNVARKADRTEYLLDGKIIKSLKNHTR